MQNLRQYKVKKRFLWLQGVQRGCHLCGIWKVRIQLHCANWHLFVRSQILEHRVDGFLMVFVIIGTAHSLPGVSVAPTGLACFYQGLVLFQQWSIERLVNGKHQTGSRSGWKTHLDFHLMQIGGFLGHPVKQRRVLPSLWPDAWWMELQQLTLLCMLLFPVRGLQPWYWMHHTDIGIQMVVRILHGESIMLSGAGLFRFTNACALRLSVRNLSTGFL